MKLRALVSAVALSAIGTISFADVTGTVKLDGKAPEMKAIDMGGVKECGDQHADPVYEETIVASDKGELANVVVYLKKEEGMELAGAEVPKEPAVLDQKGCMYSPHVIPMMVGQEMVVKNDDPFLHNVHSLAEKNPAFNFGQPNKDPGKKVDAPKTIETYKVKCDVHPWMAAWVVVLDHPFFAASKEDGKFAIKNVPDGEYTFVAWHEKLGTQEAKGTVSGGNAEVNFTFKAASASAASVMQPASFAVLDTEGPVGCCAKNADCDTQETKETKVEDTKVAKANE